MSISIEELKRSIKAVVREELGEQNPQPTESHVDHVCGCPDCYCGVIEKMKDSTFQCADCGLPLGNKEFAEKIPKCPMCGSTEAKEIEK